jgi:hypothetical protein
MIGVPDAPVLAPGRDNSFGAYGLRFYIRNPGFDSLVFAEIFLLLQPAKQGGPVPDASSRDFNVTHCCRRT